MAEMNMIRCTQDPEDIDWRAVDVDVLLVGVAAGIPGALTEARDRWPA